MASTICWWPGAGASMTHDGQSARGASSGACFAMGEAAGSAAALGAVRQYDFRATIAVEKLQTSVATTGRLYIGRDQSVPEGR